MPHLVVILFLLSKLPSARINGLDVVPVAFQSNTTAENGTSISLLCAAISNGSISKVRWLIGTNDRLGSNVNITNMTKDEITKLVPDGYATTKEMKGSRLTFSPLLPENDGVWTCAIEKDLKEAYVNVLTPPRPPTLTVDSTDWVEGKVVKFTCPSGDGNPTSSLATDWLYSGRDMLAAGIPIVKITDTPQTEKYGDFKSELTLNLSRSVFNAVISCRVRHKDPPADKTWSYEAQGIPLKFKYGPYLKVKAISSMKTIELAILPLNEVKVMEISNVSFVCTIDSYPEPSDPNYVSWFDNNVTLSGSTLELLGIERKSNKTTYSCRTKEGVPRAETKLVLDVLYPPVLKFPPNISGSTVHIAEGSNLNFSFVVEANPFPSTEDFHWSGNGKEYPSGQYLNLFRVERYASGTYICRVYTRMTPFDMVDGSVVSSESMITLVVNYAPGTAVLTSDKSNVYEGGGFTLACQVFGSDRESDMSVVWEKDDVSLNVSSTDESWVANTESPQAPPKTMIYQATLKFAKASKQDKGVYRCMGTNNAGVGPKSNPETVDVYDVPTLVSFAPAVNLLEPSEGELLAPLKCVVSGRPKPEISWVKNNHDVDPDLYNLTTVDTPESSDQSTYIVSSTFVTKRVLKASDAGNYSCQTTLKNGDSLTMRAILVAVKQKPIFTDPQVNVTADVNRTAYLRCQCYAYPIPDLTWYKDGVQFKPSTKPVPGTNRSRINETRNNWLLIHESLVAIEGVHESDAGWYVCHAENSIGIANRTTFLTVKTKPGAPSVTPPITTTWESINLIWIPGSDGGYPQSFRVHYRIKGSNYSAINPAQLGTGIEGSINVTQGTSHNITDLLPGKTYTVKVIGFNLLGDSDGEEQDVDTPAFVLPPITSVVYVIRNTAIYFKKIQAVSEDLCVFLRPNHSSSLNFTCRPVSDGQYEYSVHIDTMSYRWMTSYCLQRRNDVCGPTSVVEVDDRLLGTESAIALGVLCPLFFIVLIVGIGVAIHMCLRRGKEGEEGVPQVQTRKTSLSQMHHKKLKEDFGSIGSRDLDKQYFVNETFTSSSSDLKSMSGRNSQNLRNMLVHDSSAVDLSDAGESESGHDTIGEKRKIYHEVVV